MQVKIRQQDWFQIPWISQVAISCVRENHYPSNDGMEVIIKLMMKELSENHQELGCFGSILPDHEAKTTYRHKRAQH